jgi:hypothetical protein
MMSASNSNFSNSPQILILERLAANMFAKPYASDGKVDGVFTPARRCGKSVAVTKPIIQINGPRRIVYLCFDIDEENGGAVWIDANAPVPNIIVVNPQNHHAHLIYELREPIWLPKVGHPDTQAVRFMKRVRKALGELLGADPSYNHLLVKNPFHPSWSVRIGREQPYTLGELSEHLDLETVGRLSEIQEFDDEQGRRSILFHSGRRWAYRNLHNFETEFEFREALTRELQHLNDSFEKGPETSSTIRSTAKSISQWTWNNYSGDSRRRGIMKLDPSESLTLRQQQGQAFSSTIRVNNTIRKIQSAVRSLLSRGVKITKTSVSEESSISRKTVNIYWHVVDEITSGSLGEIVPCGQVHQEAPAGPATGGISDIHLTTHFSEQQDEGRIGGNR